MLDNVPTASTSKTASHRKINKLMMEKRRRTRINNSLSELKTLVLKALKKDGEQFSKLEKVDILEMTVKYLRYLQHQQQITLTTDPVATKYRAGFSECATEVMRYMTSVTVSEDMRGRLNDHLSKCVRTTNAHPTTTSTSTTASQSPLCSLASAPPAQEVSTYPEPMMLPIGSKQTEAGLLLTENQFKSLPTYKSSSSSSSSSTSEAGSASACRLNSVPTQTTVISSPLVSLKAFATPVSLTTSVPVLINSAAQCQQSTVSVANTTQSTPLFYNYTKSDCSAMASLHEDRLWRPW